MLNVVLKMKQTHWNMVPHYMTSISRAGSRYTLLPKDITIYDINVITGSQVKAEYVICFAFQRTTLNHAT